MMKYHYMFFFLAFFLNSILEQLFNLNLNIYFLILIFTIILILFNLLGLGNKLELKNILYYLIIIISCMFGGMLGINNNNLEN